MAQSGAELEEAEERFFTTSTESVTLGSIAGSIIMSDGSRPRGSVYAILVEGEEEIVVAQVDADESYSFPQLPDGSYTIVADLILDDGSFLGGAHDGGVDLEGGNAVDGIDISIEVPTEPVEPPVEGGPNADATASFDFVTGEGDQGEVSLEGVGPGADADVAVYFQGVTDLAGFTVTLEFSDQLAFNGAEESNASEGTNILRTSGGGRLCFCRLH